jgi:hypothetical protein
MEESFWDRKTAFWNEKELEQPPAASRPRGGAGLEPPSATPADHVDEPRGGAGLEPPSATPWDQVDEEKARRALRSGVGGDAGRRRLRAPPERRPSRRWPRVPRCGRRAERFGGFAVGDHPGCRRGTGRLRDRHAARCRSSTAGVTDERARCCTGTRRERRWGAIGSSGPSASQASAPARAPASAPAAAPVTTPPTAAPPPPPPTTAPPPSCTIGLLGTCIIGGGGILP